MAVMAKKRTKPVPWTELAEARKRRGHTQARAAELLGITQGSWSALESGRKKPSRPLAVLLDLYITGKKLL